MKKIILALIMCCSFNTSITAQVDTSKTVLLLDNKEYSSLLKKAKAQRTVGWVLIGGAIGVVTIGSIINRNNNKPSDPNSPWSNSLNTLADLNDAVILTAIAGGLTLGSIPLFVSSSRNMKKAKLLLKKQQVMITPTLKNNLNLYQLGIAVDF